MSNDPIAEILAGFDSQRDSLKRAAAQMQSVLRTALSDLQDEVHMVECRVKRRDRLERKLRLPSKHYSSLGEVTDVLGLRVITYFASDVDKVGQAITSTFVIDQSNSVDKGKALDPDRFGYSSVHYIVTLDEARIGLREYQDAASHCCEIQVRSLLQHAWAEIEHRLGYTSPEAIPRDHRRSFSRLAGLLELADNEFNRLRAQLTAYQELVIDKVAAVPDSVLLDRDSMRAFIDSSADVERLGVSIAKNESRPLEGSTDPTDAGELARMIAFVASIRTVGDLNRTLSDHQEDLVEFAQRFRSAHMTEPRSTPLPRGIAVFFLSLLLAGQSKDPSTVRRYLDSFAIGESVIARGDLASEVLTTIERLSQDGHVSPSVNPRGGAAKG